MYVFTLLEGGGILGWSKRQPTVHLTVGILHTLIA